jgi:hypothetical protein
MLQESMKPKYLMRRRFVILTQNYTSEYCRDLLLQSVPFIMQLTCNVPANIGFLCGALEHDRKDILCMVTQIL